MKKALIQTVFVLAGVFCLFAPAEAATTVSGALSGSATWTKAGSPYLVNQVEVPVGATLTVEPGAILKLNGTLGLYAFGTINIGGDGEPVVITTQKDDSFGGDSNNDGGATTPSKFDYCTIGVHTNATINIKNAHIYYGGCTPTYGQLHNLAGTLTVENSLLTKSGQFGLLAANGTTILRNTEVTENVIGVRYHRGTLTMEGNSIHGNTEYGMTNTNTAVPRVVVDARNTWWGDATGPLHTTTNPTGLGNRVSDSILYTPWKDCFNNCVSNVLFLPGIMGTRLYGNNGGEEELWVSSSDAKQEYMEMNSDGTSKNDVYTKDDTTRGSEFNETGLVDDAYGSNLYESFLEDLRNWKKEGVYTDYAFIPYDWRLSLEDIVMNGQVDLSGNLRYTTDNTDLTQSYLYQKAKALEASSKSGKVTLIGHSNGGLVIKAFVQKLKDVGDPLFYDIDKIILVGVPQTGTPDSVVSMLYGSKIGIAWLGVSAERSRSLIHGMPTMYNLLPSEKLFDSINPPIEFVGNNIDPSWTTRYGDKINTYAELRDFLTGVEGRTRPEYSDTFAPEVLRDNLLSQAEGVHQTLDNWVPAPETEVVQIAGWGMYTVAGLRVVDEKVCQFDANQLIGGRPVCYENTDGVTVEDKLTLNGDATVVVPSAHDIPESGSVKKYWVDLGTYNNRTFIQRFTPDTKHKDIFEVSSLRPFIKSIISSDIIDTEDDYITAFEPAPLNKVYIKYEIHSPLHLTVTDTDGRVTGWDSAANIVVEHISGAQYFEIGEVKTVLIPKDTPHTVRLTAYAQGSFSFTQQALQGEEVLSETKFSAIPTLENTVVDIIPSAEETSLEMKLDFDADGTTETALTVVSGEVTEYPNPVPEDTTPPEARIGYDTSTKNLVITSLEEGVVVTQSGNIYTLTDGAGNTTKLTFAESRHKKDRKEKEKFVLQSIQYNQDIPVVLQDTQLRYTYKEGKREEGGSAFTSSLRTSALKLTAHYLKRKNQTYIMDKSEHEDDDPETCESRGVRKILPGLVVPYMETSSGKINIKY